MQGLDVPVFIYFILETVDKGSETMVTTGLQVFAFILAFTAWALMVATCVSPHWRENSVPGTVTEQHQRFFNKEFNTNIVLQVMEANVV